MKTDLLVKLGYSPNPDDNVWYNGLVGINVQPEIAIFDTYDSVRHNEGKVDLRKGFYRKANIVEKHLELQQKTAAANAALLGFANEMLNLCTKAGWPMFYMREGFEIHFYSRGTGVCLPLFHTDASSFGLDGEFPIFTPNGDNYYTGLYNGDSRLPLSTDIVELFGTFDADDKQSEFSVGNNTYVYKDISHAYSRMYSEGVISISKFDTPNEPDISGLPPDLRASFLKLHPAPQKVLSMYTIKFGRA